MDGVAAARSVLIANSDLTALVPATNIAAGPLPLNVTLPAISLESISKVDNNLPNPGAKRHVVERVQVTVFAPNYPKQKQILRAVRKAAADKFYPTIPGISEVTIVTESAGPDFMNEEATIFKGSQDFRITFNEPR